MYYNLQKYESLCYTPEGNIIWEINYTSVKKTVSALELDKNAHGFLITLNTECGMCVYKYIYTIEYF